MRSPRGILQRGQSTVDDIATHQIRRRIPDFRRRIHFRRRMSHFRRRIYIAGAGWGYPAPVLQMWRRI